MSSLVEVIAKQAQATFSRSVTEETFSDLLSKLVKSVRGVRPSDLKLTRDVLRAANSSSASKPSAPVTYIEVTENQVFSMGIFLLRSGSRIPLHDHPGMHGVLKVIHGTVRITSYSAYPSDESVPEEKTPLPQDVAKKVKSSQRDSLIPVVKQTSGSITEKDEPCVLKPREGNYHEICAVGGTAAFLDILAPPYDMKERDCHYYLTVETKDPDSKIRTWLLRRPPPADFWCESAAYLGPKVSL